MTPCANDNWVRRFIVSDPRKYGKGFTIYKVTSIVYPKGCPEAATKVIVWKRFNDFKKLHHELQQKHKKLYLKGKFPMFPEPKFFGRFEEEVIEERRKCATVLLEFIGGHPPLFTSNGFVKFFETGYNADDCKELDHLVEKPDNGCPNPPSCQQHSMLIPSNSSNEIFQLRREANGSLLKLGGTWQFPKVSDSVSLSSRSSEEPTSFPDTDSVLSVSSAVQKEKSWEFALDVKESLDHPSAGTLPAGTQGSSPRNEYTQDYIVQANHHVTQALRRKEAGAYEAAFSLLKLGISCLFTGVKEEKDTARRHAVRSKATEYLAAAEKLYNEHLASRLPNAVQLPHSCPSTAYPLPGMQAFKVLGVIGKVMLAMNTEDQCYIVKVLYKSPCPVNKLRVPVLPRSVPYMVKLHFYFETDSAVFLFLQHASGGRLWDHILSYFHSHPPTPVHLLSHGNVYLGRKLFEETPRRRVTEMPNDDDSLLSEQEDSYAALIKNYTEGRNKINVGANFIKYDTNQTPDCVVGQRQEADNIDSCQVEDNSPKISEVSSLYNPLEDFNFAALEEGVDIKGGEQIETNELMRNAQQLLKSVNETLLKTSVGDQESFHEISRVKKNVLELNSRQIKSSAMRRHSSGTRLSQEHCLSSDDLFECRTYTSGGGSLRRWKRPTPRLPEGHIRRWAEQLVTCLAALHESGLVFRDMHPDNVLLSEEGHLLVTYTCIWPAVDKINNREAVQNLYAAPEISSIFDVTPSADWWSLGAILYELFTGQSLHLSQPGGIHSHSIMCFPDFVSPEARSLLTELLRYDPRERLVGIEEIKSHPFFAGTNWSEVYNTGLQVLS